MKYINYFRIALLIFDWICIYSHSQLGIRDAGKAAMSLFVGNLSRNIPGAEFIQIFKSYGNCKVDLRAKYAFVVYERDSDAEKALHDLDNTMVCGHRINVEWSRQSGRFAQNAPKRIPTREKSWSRGKMNISRSPDRGGRRRERKSPDYRYSRSNSSIDSKDCPRDRELKQRIAEMKIKKKEKKKKDEEIKQRVK